MPKRNARTRKEDTDPALRYRAAKVVSGHPWMTLSTLSALVAILPVLGGGLLWAFGFIETAAHAQAREDKLRDELKANVATIYAEINKNKREADDFRAGYGRESAGTLLQLLENRMKVTQYRTNDCEIRRADKKRPMTSMEINACTQYDDDYREARRRFENQQTDATRTWRTR